MYSEARAIALEAGRLALSFFNRVSELPVEEKGHCDLVTIADKQVEFFLQNELAHQYPDDGFFGEEGSDRPGTSGRTWVLDPIDGTFNFVRGSDQWAVSIGLYEKGVPQFGIIHAPARNEIFVGGRNVPPTLNGKELKPHKSLDRTKAAVNVGFHPVIPVPNRLEVIRFLLEDAGMTFKSCSSATISMMQLAVGEVDGYVGFGESSWDLMAALAILEPLGVTTTIDWSETALDTRFRFAAGTPDFLEVVEPILPYGSGTLPKF